MRVHNGFKLHNGKQEHQFKLALLTERHSGILVRTDKTIVKEAMINLMEDLRFFARARRNVDVVWGIATNLFEWQIVRYIKSKEEK